MSDLPKIVGERLRSFRRDKGWSQEQLAEISGLHNTYIGQVERGEKNATLESLEKITGALGITLEELFRFMQPAAAGQDVFTLSQIVNKLQGRGPEDQQTVLKMLDLMLEWKDK